MNAVRRCIASLIAASLLAACARPHGGDEAQSSDRPAPIASNVAPRHVPAAADSAAVRATLDRFIADFNALDSARFSAHWRDDASAILPFADTPHRLDGRSAVLARFMRYFAEMRAERSGPPYLHMLVRNVRIDFPAERVAVIAYEFDAAGTVRNRTLVLSRDEDGRWRILQMHGG